MACLVALFAPAALGQVTVFNDFGPGHDGWDYNWGLGWTIAGENLTGQYGVEQAMGFTSPSTGVVSDVWVAMWYRPLDSLPDEVTLRLARNPNGQPPRPEDVMEEWLITDFDSWSQWNPPIHLEASGTSLLEAGASYWLWASGGETTWCGWCMNSNPGYTCRHTLRREGEDWLPIANETASAFRVDAWPRELGDLNCDGDINGFDIDPFVLVMSTEEPYDDYYDQHPNCDHNMADINGDGVINGFDIDAFVALLSGG